MAPVAAPLKKSAKSRISARAFFEPAKKKAVKINLPPKKTPSLIVKRVNSKSEAKEGNESKKSSAEALRKPVREIKASSKKYQQHKEADTVVGEAQHAAILPAIQSNKAAANRSQVEIMAAQTPDTKKFDKIKFKDKLEEKIRATIKSKEDAKKVGNNGVGENVTKDIGNTLEDEKSKAGGKVESSAIVAPNSPKTPDGEVTIAEPVGLKMLKPEPATLTAQRANLAPVKRSSPETDFTKETRVLDDTYTKNRLSKEKLQNSNEPSFIKADNSKQESQTKAAQLTNDTRAREVKTIAAAKNGNTNAMNTAYGNMLLNHSGINGGRFDKQTEKSNEENKIRKDVSTELDRIFKNTNEQVLACFKGIDDYVEKVFGNDLTKNLNKFSTRVADLLDDNTGIFNNIGAAITGDDLMSEAQIFDVAKVEFINDMQKPIDDLVDKVDTYLTWANGWIELGKEEKNKFWNKQSNETKRIAGNIFDDATLKFKELESSVQAKEEAVIDTITEKFSNALDELDSRFAKAVEENKSWLDKAVDAVKGVINTIIELKNALVAIAQKAAAYVERIMDDPAEFFGNLSDGVGKGFSNFKNNIDKHLIKGVLEWLTGSMAGSEIELPKQLDGGGITSLVLQILGISIKKIREIVIGIIGKERFEFIEKGVDAGISAGNRILDMFKILNEKGLMGLWEFIMDEFSNLKETLIENAKSFVIEAITQKAIEILLSLLIPGAGFIRAAQLLIKFVITLFQKAAQILKIIEGIINTFGDILSKNFASAAAKVEQVFSNFLSLAISFLAAVLGLDGIAGRVRKFIQQKIRPKIDAALNKIAMKIKQVIEKVGLVKLIDKSMTVVEKGKNWAEEKKKKAIETGKAGVGKLLSWLGLKKSFQAADNKSHSINIGGKEKDPRIIIKSTPKTLEELIADFKATDEYKKSPGKFNPKIEKATMLKDRFEAAMEKNDPSANHDKEFETMANAMINYIRDMFVTTNSSEKSIRNFGGEKNGVASSMEANPLINDNVNGEITSGATGIYVPLFKRKHRDGNVPYYIQGHLLNHHLGGPNKTTNLTPLKRSTNSEHERIIEKSLKHFYSEKKKLKYIVTPIYGLSVPITEPVPASNRSKTIKEIKEQEQKSVPVSISIQSSHFIKNDDGSEKEVGVYNATINNNIETNDADYVI